MASILHVSTNSLCRYLCHEILSELWAFSSKKKKNVWKKFFLSDFHPGFFFRPSFSSSIRESRPPAKLTSRPLTFSPFAVASSSWKLSSLAEARKRRDRWLGLVKPCRRSTSCVLILPTPASGKLIIVICNLYAIYKEWVSRCDC